MTSDAPAVVGPARIGETTDRAEDAAPDGDGRLPVAPLAPLAAWGVMVAVAVAVGIGLRTQAKIGAPPLTGGLAVPFLPAAVAALVGAVAVAWRLPDWCARVPWRRLVVGMALLAMVWGVGLALVRGPSGFNRGLSSRFEYPAVVPAVDRIGVGPFVDSFTDPAVLARYPIHVQGHPLGAALAFVGLDRIGLGGSLGASAFLLVVGAGTVPAVLVAVREVAGEARARQAAPFLVLVPAAVWAVSSADALYACVGAWAVTLVVLATSDTRPVRWRTVAAVAGGLAFGVGIHLSYGLVPLVLVPVVVAVARRRPAALGWAAAGGLLVLAASASIGFWWFDGLAATRARYVAGVASSRPYAYFTFLGNPAAFAIALGPVAAVAVARVRDRRLWLLAGGALAAVTVADLSGLSKAEVERIWLPFVPWVLVLAAGLAGPGGGVSSGHGDGRRPGPWPPLARGLLVVQAVTAVVLESVVRTIW